MHTNAYTSKKKKKLNLKKKYAKLKKEIFFFNQMDLLTISVSLDSATVSSRFCGARIRESWSGTSSGHVCRVSNFRHSIVATGKLSIVTTFNQ